MALPPEALARLRALTTQLIEVGDVWWLPAEHVAFFPGGKARFCLVAGIERTTGGTPGLVHLVAGSTNPATGSTTIHVDAEECGLHEETYFKFRWSGTVAVPVLTSDGRWRGRLQPERVSEIEAVVKASHLVALKRVWA